MRVISTFLQYYLEYKYSSDRGSEVKQAQGVSKFSFVKSELLKPSGSDCYARLLSFLGFSLLSNTGLLKWIPLFHLKVLGCPHFSKWQKQVKAMAKGGNSFDTGREKAPFALCLTLNVSCIHLSCLFLSVALFKFSPLLGITFVQMLTGAYRWQQPSETVADAGWISAFHTLSWGTWGVVWIMWWVNIQTNCIFRFQNKEVALSWFVLKIFVILNKTNTQCGGKIVITLILTKFKKLLVHIY